MNAHAEIKAEQAAKEESKKWDRIMLDSGEHARRAQATAIIWTQFLRTFKESSEVPRGCSTETFLNAMKREIDLIDMYVEDLDNEARLQNEALWEVAYPHD